MACFVELPSLLVLSLDHVVGAEWRLDMLWLLTVNEHG